MSGAKNIDDAKSKPSSDSFDSLALEGDSRETSSGIKHESQLGKRKSHENTSNEKKFGDSSSFSSRVTEEPNAPENCLDITQLVSSQSPSCSSKNTTPNTSLTSNRDKRVRKKKKFDDDFVQFDLAPSTSGSKIPKADVLPEAEPELGANEETTSSLVEPIYVENSLDCFSEMDFSKGDLVWAKVGGHPWWPCMISSFPPPKNLAEVEVDNQLKNHTKSVGSNKAKKTFCVLFFGSAIEHAWVSDSCLINYEGLFLV